MQLLPRDNKMNPNLTEQFDISLQLGNKTECALLGLVLDFNQNYESYRKKFPEEAIVKIYTFNSERKSMMTVVRREGGGYRVYAKGASEIILSR